MDQRRVVDPSFLDLVRLGVLPASDPAVVNTLAVVAWPLLNGERGEYHIAAGQHGAARGQLSAMARAAGPGLMLPEQVWDHQPPAGTDGFAPGTPTFSATPLAWTHAQFIRLAWDATARRVLEQPRAVAERYLRA